MVGYATVLSSMAYPKQFLFFEDSKPQIKVESFVTESDDYFLRKKSWQVAVLIHGPLRQQFYEWNALPSALAGLGSFHTNVNTIFQGFAKLSLERHKSITLLVSYR